MSLCSFQRTRDGRAIAHTNSKSTAHNDPGQVAVQSAEFTYPIALSTNSTTLDDSVPPQLDFVGM